MYCLANCHCCCCCCCCFPSCWPIYSHRWAVNPTVSTVRWGWMYLCAIVCVSGVKERCKKYTIGYQCRTNSGGMTKKSSKMLIKCTIMLAHFRLTWTKPIHGNSGSIVAWKKVPSVTLVWSIHSSGSFETFSKVCPHQCYQTEIIWNSLTTHF